MAYTAHGVNCAGAPQRIGASSAFVDISLPEDGNGGLVIYCTSGGSCQPSGREGASGTSQGSPMAAAALAEVSQIRGSANDFVTSAIYAATVQSGGSYSNSMFVHITVGTNGQQVHTSWDMVTGVGTPDWYVLSSASGI